MFVKKLHILPFNAMLLEFSVGNYRSFKDLQTLSMLAAKDSTSGEDSRIIATSFGINLLKSKAIYGANASGKSNVIKALFAFLLIVRESLKDESILTKVIQPFAFSTETEHQPSFFQIIFVVEDIQYRYGFEATSEKITAEWLMKKSLAKPRTKEIALFVRENQDITLHEKHFREGQILLRRNDLVRENSLFLSAVASFHHSAIARKVSAFIVEIGIISGDSTENIHRAALQKLDTPEFAERMQFMLQVADRSIKSVARKELTKTELPTNLRAITSFDEMSEQDRFSLAVTKHTKFDAQQSAIGESELVLADGGSNGTKKMFELSPVLIDTILREKVLFIDELEARLHPRLTRKIIEAFHSIGNHSAQLIFITHDINLLSDNLLRKEQIAFVDKDKFGASSLYTLANFKGILKDTSVSKEYMRGKYGAVPFVGDFASFLGMEE